MATRRETDHERARLFAVRVVMRASRSELNNLAQSYLTAMHSITELSREVAELRLLSPKKGARKS